MEGDKNFNFWPKYLPLLKSSIARLCSNFFESLVLEALFSFLEEKRLLFRQKEICLVYKHLYFKICLVLECKTKWKFWQSRLLLKHAHLSSFSGSLLRLWVEPHPSWFVCGCSDWNHRWRFRLQTQIRGIPQMSEPWYVWFGFIS